MLEPGAACKPELSPAPLTGWAPWAATGTTNSDPLGGRAAPSCTGSPPRAAQRGRPLGDFTPRVSPGSQDVGPFLGSDLPARPERPADARSSFAPWSQADPKLREGHRAGHTGLCLDAADAGRRKHPEGGVAGGLLLGLVVGAAGGRVSPGPPCS